MRELELGRVVRALRRRRGWRQVDCAGRAGVHRSTWSNLERGQIGQLAVRTLHRCLAVLEVRLDLVPRWRGADLDRLLDAAHASLQAVLVDRLRAWGWQVFVEVSFNRYGDRGRIDVLAWHPRVRLLVVGEVKSDIVDAQGLLGPLDVKVRVAGQVARQLNLGPVAFVVPLLFVADSPTIRRRIERFGPLFARFDIRGRAATSLLRAPDAHSLAAAGGLLIFSSRSYANGRSAKAVGRQRVRVKRTAARTDPSTHLPAQPVRSS